MKANPQILDVLNDVLTAELTAINQYFLHAKMLQNWGYNVLAKHVRDESIDEMRHAEELCERILYLEGVPNLQRLGKLKIGESPKEQLENDLAMEYDAVKRFNDGIKVCRDLGGRGFAAVEAYPEARAGENATPAARPEFWLRAGFVLAVDDDRYPVMRLELR